MNKCCVWKNYGECKKAQRHPTCQNWQSKKLSSVGAYHTTKQKIFSEIVLATETNKTTVKWNKSVYLGLSILDISKNSHVRVLVWRVKYGGKAKLSYTDIFIVHMKTEDVYAYIAGNVEQRFDTPNCEVQRPLPIKKIKK